MYVFLLNHPTNYNYSASKVEYILTHTRSAEIVILGISMFIISSWLSSSFTHQPNKQAFNFAVIYELDQVMLPTAIIPDHLPDTPNILHIFLQPLIIFFSTVSSVGFLRS